VDYKKLESEIKNIIDLVEKIPEKYKEKTFEILLNRLLEEKPENGTPDDVKPASSSIVIPIEVKGLLKKNNIPEKSLEKIFFIENKQVVPIYELPTDKKATSQIQLALLLALENSLNEKSGKLEFSLENVRQGCKDRKCYDPRNFMKNFNDKKTLFGSFEDSENISLVKDGRDELAKTIQDLL